MAYGEPDLNRVTDRAEQELERIKLPAVPTNPPRTGTLVLDTELGPIDIGVAEALITDWARTNNRHRGCPRVGFKEI